MILLYAGLAATGAAQNLVPNGSFEEYDECPDQLNQMYRATGWTMYRGSPDYFNRCSNPGTPPAWMTGVPLNSLGWQEAATGDAYAGVILWTENLFGGQSREHFGAMLTEPLVPGVPVYISFKVSPTTGGVLEDMHWTVDGAGLRFVMAPYFQNGLDPLPNEAALYMTYPPSDTSAWYQLRGVFVPDSAYEYVVLGNFLADTLITLTVLNSDGTGETAYVYYDDVCVSYEAEVCGIVAGVEGINPGPHIRVYPMPFSERCTIVLDRSYAMPLEVELFDQLGRSTWRDRLIPGEKSIDMNVPDLPAGAYMLRTTLPMGALPPIVLIRVVH